ncbi:MAG: HEPN domain-containing protein [Prosthecobacter sp.]|uniref:HEPN domain-containing protein n=1 Tax=Prosthecobacter sp. TaxID=1965333 RepID=UPI00390111AC
MKPSTLEWIKKAESDYQLALTLARRRKTLVRDQACFMFQQSAEKYLKARLEEANRPFPKTHQLQDLVTLTLPVEPLWSALFAAAGRLSVYAVAFRYPGYEANATQMQTAMQDAKAIRKEARLALGL